MKLTKSFIDEISRDYMKFLLDEAGKAVCLEKIMEQAERFDEVKICTRRHMFSPYEFALLGGRDSDIKEVRYGINAKYGTLRNIICHVEDGELVSVCFTVDLCNDKSITNITMEQLRKYWSASNHDFLNELVEVFEVFLDEHNMIIPNDEKTDAVLSGEDEDSLANIYGSDYGWLEDRLGEVLGVSCYE